MAKSPPNPIDLLKSQHNSSIPVELKKAFQAVAEQSTHHNDRWVANAAALYLFMEASPAKRRKVMRLVKRAFEQQCDAVLDRKKTIPPGPWMQLIPNATE